MDLNKATEKELIEELERRKEIRRQAYYQKVSEMEQYVYKNIEAYLTVFRNHYYTSCSDENPQNEDRECLRCKLLDAQTTGYFDSSFNKGNKQYNIFPEGYKTDSFQES